MSINYDIKETRYRGDIKRLQHMVDWMNKEYGRDIKIDNFTKVNMRDGDHKAARLLDYDKDIKPLEDRMNEIVKELRKRCKYYIITTEDKISDYENMMVKVLSILSFEIQVLHARFPWLNESGYSKEFPWLRISDETGAYVICRYCKEKLKIGLDQDITDVYTKHFEEHCKGRNHENTAN